MDQRSKKLIVLDLNGILCRRMHKCKAAPKGTPLVDKYEWLRDATLVDDSYLVAREGVIEFMRELQSEFKVAVWSTAFRKNTMSALAYILPGSLIDKLLFVFSGDECTNSGKRTKSGKPIVFKDLKTVWDEYPEYNEGNTWVVENDSYKLQNNPERTKVVWEEWPGTERTLSKELSDVYDLVY
jgi:hypothetical protein